MNKKSVLLLLTSISDYRVFLYNRVNTVYDLTVGYYKKDNTKSLCTFKKIKLSFFEIGPFIFIKNNLKRISKDYDVIIFEPNLHNVSYILLPFINLECKLITWSIGIRASYTKRYNLNRKKEFLDYILLLLYKKSNAMIVYTKQAITFWSNTGLDLNKIFIAHNTVTVLDKFSIDTNLKDSILFIGTLYPEKRIGELLKTYALVYDKYKERTPFLLIIGDGPEKNKINNFIIKNNLSHKIKLFGAIYDEEKVEEFFSRSLICVSPDQAGLSVLKVWIRCSFCYKNKCYYRRRNF